MSRLRILFLILGVCLVSASRAQITNFSSEVRFIQYLIDKEQFREANYLMEKFSLSGLLPAQADTLNYLKGWSAYTNKKLDTAVRALSRVSSSFPLYNKSRFFSAYSAAFLLQRDSARSILKGVEVADSVAAEARSFELAGLALLDRNYSEYFNQQKHFTYSLFPLQKEEERFKKYQKDLAGYKRKSGLLAGVYSAVLPGAGKFYAGRKKQGIASFLPILSLGAITYESYRKAGIKNARTLVFGSLFSVFYVGNIWGSVLAVKIKQKEFDREYDNKILFDMHIPLRNLYN
jgi:TM2 domain-containing membrane protein YozV